MDTSLGLCCCIEPDVIKNKLVSMLGDELDYYSVQKIFNKGRVVYFLGITSQKELPKENIARNISEWIVDCFEQKLLSDIFDIYFEGIDLDKMSIIQKTLEKTEKITGIYFDKYFVKKLTKYLDEDNFINIEGFVRFRLSDYRWKLYDRLCETVEEYYIKQEYKEFVELLKGYIEERQPMIDLLHIKPCSDGNFSLYDLKKEKIDISIEKNSVCNQIEFFLTKDDMLLSILIALAPRRIIWHDTKFFKNQNLCNTIKEIFGSSFSLCEGCDLCKN